MSTHTDVTVWCDGRVPDPALKSGTRRCPAEVKGGEHGGRWVFPRTKAEARKLAKSLGWAVERSPLGRAFDKDLCPEHRSDHKPQEGRP